MMRIALTNMMLFFSIMLTHAQSKDSVFVGEIEGIAFDSIHNYVLKSATVAIYKGDATVNPINYMLTNNLGEFYFQRLPLGVDLKIIISYVGYNNTIISFFINNNQKKINFGKLNLYANDKVLDNVTIKYVPPVRFNKDTLEFNPNAFQMEENSVVEDLLRKLPGVIVWGDGTITVNGREVKSVVVDGKPFFGGSTKVAIQNIPKDIVEKVQVYQQSTSQINQLDSITLVNIKLKKNLNSGKFGKVDIGLGNNKRFETTANLNLFRSKTQLAVIGTHNNVNKIADNLNTLLENNTYTGKEGSFDYQPEFRMAGVNKPLQAGLFFQQDFIEKTDNFNIDRLTADYFLQNNIREISTNTHTTIALGSDSALTQKVQTGNNISGTNHRFNTKYQKGKDNSAFNIGLVYLNDNKDSKLFSSSEIDNAYDQIQSKNSLQTNINTNIKSIGLSGDYTLGNHSIAGSKFLKLNYSIYNNKDLSQEFLKNNFESYFMATQNQKIDRKYSINKKYFNSSFNFALDNLLTVHTKKFDIFKVDAGAEIIIAKTSRINEVSDMDSITGKYLQYSYLTNNERHTGINIVPFINFKRTFSKTLSNRYAQILDINIFLKGQTFHQKNVSSRAFQNFDREYFTLLPEASIKFTNYQFGKLKDVYAAKYFTNSGFPAPYQLVPLVDSANIFNINYGNINLRSFQRNELILSLSHSTFKKNNPLAYDIAFKVGNIHNYITDSSIIDYSGLTKSYPINIDGYKYSELNFHVTKSIKIKNQTLQIIFNNFSEYSKRPNYVNKNYYKSVIWQNNSEIDLFYYLSSYLSINLGQSFSYYSLHQSEENDNQFRNLLHQTKIIVNSSLTNRLNISSSLFYNRGASSGATPIDFKIWNASIAYRLFKKKNAQIKVSAFDLLHQNSNIINYGLGNKLTIGKNNVLEQYFMLTFSFFPRKFGNNNSK